jgi:uncharacterized membrane protein YbhN (UPF0104 family)
VIGGEVVHKIFFMVAGAFVYLYLFLSVPGSFELQLGSVANHPVLVLLLIAGVLVALVLLGRAFWSRLAGLWEQAKRGGAILADRKAYLAKVVLPSFGAWVCKLAVIGIFLAAYAIPVTLHTVMTVAGGNSLANVVSFTPGGVGVNQAVNSATLTREDVDRETAIAYSTGQQLITTAWNMAVAIVLVAVVFGWAGGKRLVAMSYAEAKESAPHRGGKRPEHRSLRKRLRRRTAS